MHTDFLLARATVRPQSKLEHSSQALLLRITQLYSQEGSSALPRHKLGLRASVLNHWVCVHPNVCQLIDAVSNSPVARPWIRFSGAFTPAESHRLFCPLKILVIFCLKCSVSRCKHNKHR